jgi:hypothetical protein
MGFDYKMFQVKVNQVKMQCSPISMRMIEKTNINIKIQ